MNHQIRLVPETVTNDIKVHNMVQTRDGCVVVRLRSEEDAGRLKEAEALKGCSFQFVSAKFPKLIIFGTRCRDKEELIRDLFDQNEEIRTVFNAGNKDEQVAHHKAAVWTLIVRSSHFDSDSQTQPWKQ